MLSVLGWERVVSRKGQSITLSISDDDKARLESLARELNLLRGDRPNISRLVEAVARRELLLGRNHDWSEARILALQHAMAALTDAGQIEEARIVAYLLLERSELSTPLQQQIEQFLETPIAAWRQEIEALIRRQTPFQLAYRDAADRLWQFTIRHARLNMRDRRQYLECWCDESNENQDLPELSHNWTLRLDRIPDAAMLAVEGVWRSSLDEIEVEIHLFEGLAFAYQARQGDVINEWVDRTPPVRRVVRRISSTFWFFREIRPYGKDCEIVAPDSVRDRFRRELQEMCDRYERPGGK